MRIHTILTGLVLAGLLASGCELLGFVDGKDRTPDRVVVVEDETVSLGENATLAFVEQVAESRCPWNVTCVWPGEARIRVRLQPRGLPPATFDLTLPGLTGPDDVDERNALDTLGFRLVLLQLEPYPTAAQPQPDVKATATIGVERH